MNVCFTMLTCCLGAWEIQSGEHQRVQHGEGERVATPS